MSVSKSTNGGVTWQRYTRTSNKGFTYALAIDPTNSNIVYAGGWSETGATLFKTVNGGDGWSSIVSGITGDTIHDIAIHPSNTNTLYAVTQNGVFKSTNAGGSWNNKGCTEVQAIEIDPTGPDTLYAGTWNGVFRSTDGGDTWTAMNDGLQSLHITSLDISTDTYLYCGTDSAGIYRWSLQVGVAEGEKETDPKESAYYVQPNPARNSTSIYFNLATPSNVHIAIYDVQGRIIQNLTDDKYNAGKHRILWNGKNDSNLRVASGVYICKIRTNTESRTQKIVLFN